MRTGTTPTTVQRSNTSPSKKLSDAEIKRIAGLKKGAQNSAQDVAKLVKHIKGHGISQVLLDEIFDNLLVNERKAVIEAVLEKDLMPSKIIDKILLEKDGFLLGILKDKNPDKVIELAAQSQALTEMVQKNQTETKPTPMSPGGKALMELVNKRRPMVIQSSSKEWSSDSALSACKKAIDEEDYQSMCAILIHEKDTTLVMRYAIEQGNTDAIQKLLWNSSKLGNYTNLLHDMINVNENVAQYTVRLISCTTYSSHFQKIVNNVDEQGNTPLHIAVQKQNSKMVEELLKIGADIRILNKFKQSALDLAGGDSKVLLQKHIEEKKIEMLVVAWDISSGTPTKLGGYKPIGDESDKHEVIPKPKRLNLDATDVEGSGKDPLNEEDDDVLQSQEGSSDQEPDQEEKAAAEKAEQERIAREEAQKEAAAKARAEEEARAEEKHLAEEKEQQRIAEEKAAVEKAEQERIAQEKAELERQEQAAKAERERQEQKEQEEKRLEQEKLQKEAAKARAEEKAAVEKAEQERIAAEKAELERQQQLKREAEEKTQRDSKEAEEESAYKFRTCMAVGSLFASGSGASLFAAYKYQEVVLAKVSPFLEGHYFNVAKTTLANNKYGSMMTSFVSENQQKCILGSAVLFVIGSFVCGYVIANLCSGKSADAGVQK